MDNAVLQNMRQRRSCRAFLPQQITLEEMETVIEAGAWAASGMGRQPVVFVAVQDKATRDTLSALNAKWMGKEEGFDPFYGAPTVVVVLVKADIPTAVEDGSLAIGNMMNAAASIGLVALDGSACDIDIRGRCLNEDAAAIGTGDIA